MQINRSNGLFVHIMFLFLLVALTHICTGNIVENAHDVLRKTSLITGRDHIDPCDDFYKYACENPQQLNLTVRNEGVESNYLNVVKRKVEDLLIKSLEEDVSSHVGYEIAWNKARKFYLSCLEVREENAFPELTRLVRTIGNFPVINQTWDEKDFNWVKSVSTLRKYGLQAIMHESVAAHWKDSAVAKIYLVASKFDFVHAEDLLGTSQNSEEYVFFYKRYIKLVFLALGLRVRKAIGLSEQIVAFETKLAEIVSNETEITPPEPISLDTLQARIPQIDWVEYLTGVLGKPVDTASLELIVDEDYYRKLANLISQIDRRTIAQYLLFKFIFKFRAGATENYTPRHCIQVVNQKMSTTLGKVYYRTGFSAENQKSASEIAVNVKTAFEEILNGSSWLDPSTKSAALEKLKAMRVIVGFPDDVLSESEEKCLNLTENYYENCLKLAKCQTEAEHDQLQKGISSFLLSPVDVNAFYKVTRNTIFIPAALLIPPIFDKDYPKFYNYAILGAIIGHELTHGFDFEGRNYNARGSVENWWTTKSLIAYLSHIDCMLTQFKNISGARPRGTVGSFGSISENVADSGGVQVAYKAFIDWIQRSPDSVLAKEAESLANLTREQSFFVSFARFWCSSDDSGESGIHSSSKYRVFNSLSSFSSFAGSFGCQPGSTMNPIQKCKLW